MALSQTQVSQLYVSIFGRASEGEGNTFWQQGADMVSTATEMLATPQAVAYFGDTLTDNQAFIEHIYLNTLGKTYADDPDGIDYWTGRLDAGESQGTIIADLIAAAQAPENAGDAQDQFNNKVAISNYTADNIENVTTLSTFAGFIDEVDHTQASVTDAMAEVDTATPGTLSVNLEVEAAAGADVMRLTGNQDVRIDLTGNDNQLEGIDLDNDGVIEHDGVENNDPTTQDDGVDFEIVDAYTRNPLNHSDFGSNFLGDIDFDGTGFAGDGVNTDGNIFLGGLGADTALGGIGNDFLAGGGVSTERYVTEYDTDTGAWIWRDTITDEIYQNNPGIGLQDSLSGGRNADFFFTELSLLDFTDGDALTIDGGSTSDDAAAGDGTPQDSDWLLIEASDDDEPVTIDLDSVENDDSNGTIRNSNGTLFVNLDNIENVDASGNLYGFLDDMNTTIGGKAGELFTPGEGNENVGLGSSAQLIIDGSEENNILIGGFDNDRIDGDTGDDLIFGGRLDYLNNPNLTAIVNDGVDELFGGAGDDNIVFEADGGVVEGDDNENADDGNNDTLWLTELSLGTQAVADMTTDSTLRFDLGVGFFGGLDNYAGYGGADQNYSDGDYTADQTNYAAGIDRVQVQDIENIDATGLGSIDYLAAGTNDPELSFNNQQNIEGLNENLDSDYANLDLRGTVGDNGLYASLGNDVLEGRQGDDILMGGRGNDDFIFRLNGDGLDQIKAKVDADNDSLWDEAEDEDGNMAVVWGQDFGFLTSNDDGASYLYATFPNTVDLTDPNVGVTQFEVTIDGVAYGTDLTAADLSSLTTTAQLADVINDSFNAQNADVTVEAFDADTIRVVVADADAVIGVNLAQGTVIAGTAVGAPFQVNPTLDVDADTLSGDRLIFRAYEDRADNELMDDDHDIDDVVEATHTTSLGAVNYAEDLVARFTDNGLYEEDGTTLTQGQSYVITFANLNEQDEVSLTVNGVTYTATVGINPDGTNANGDYVLAGDNFAGFLARFAGLINSTDDDTQAGSIAVAAGATTLRITQGIQVGGSGEDIYMDMPVVDVTSNDSNGEAPTVTVAETSATSVFLQDFYGTNNMLNSDNVIFDADAGVSRSVFETADNDGGALTGSDALAYDTIADADSIVDNTAHGDDLLFTGIGDDVVTAFTGDDRVFASIGEDTADGGKHHYLLDADGSLQVLNQYEAAALNADADATNDVTLLQAYTDTFVVQQSDYPGSTFTIDLDAGLITDPADAAVLADGVKATVTYNEGTNDVATITNFEMIRTVSGNDDNEASDSLNLEAVSDAAAAAAVAGTTTYTMDTGMVTANGVNYARVHGTEHFDGGDANDTVTIDESEVGKVNNINLGDEDGGDDTVAYDFTGYAFPNAVKMTVTAETADEVDTVSFTGAVLDQAYVDTLTDVEVLDISRANVAARTDDVLDVTNIDDAVVAFGAGIADVGQSQGGLDSTHVDNNTGEEADRLDIGGISTDGALGDELLTINAITRLEIVNTGSQNDRIIVATDDALNSKTHDNSVIDYNADSDYTFNMGDGTDALDFRTAAESVRVVVSTDDSDSDMVFHGHEGVDSVVTANSVELYYTSDDNKTGIPSVAQVQSEAITAMGVGDSVTVTINGNNYNQAFDTDVATTLAALVVQINAGADPVTAVGNGVDTFTITADDAGTGFGYASVATGFVMGAGGADVANVAGTYRENFIDLTQATVDTTTTFSVSSAEADPNGQDTPVVGGFSTIEVSNTADDTVYATFIDATNSQWLTLEGSANAETIVVTDEESLANHEFDLFAGANVVDYSAVTNLETDDVDPTDSQNDSVTFIVDSFIDNADILHRVRITGTDHATELVEAYGTDTIATAVDSLTVNASALGDSDTIVLADFNQVSGLIAGVDWAHNRNIANLTTGVVSEVVTYAQDAATAVGAGVDVDDNVINTINVANFENVTGSNVTDLITGNENGNILAGLAGDDVINGLAGADIITATTGSNQLDGGGGDDVIIVTLAAGAADENSIIGGSGNDIITMAGANAASINAINAGEGDDVIVGSNGIDTILGGADEDTITDGDLADSITGGAGVDTITLTADLDADRVIFAAFTDSAYNVAAGNDGDEIIGFVDGTDKFVVNIDDGNVGSFHGHDIVTANAADLDGDLAADDNLVTVDANGDGTIDIEFALINDARAIAVSEVEVLTVSGTVEAGDIYSVTINETTFDYITTGLEGTVDGIAAAIAGVINAGVDEGVTAAGVGAGGDITLTADVAGQAFDATVTLTDQNTIDAGFINDPADLAVVANDANALEVGDFILTVDMSAGADAVDVSGIDAQVELKYDVQNDSTLGQRDEIDGIDFSADLLDFTGLGLTLVDYDALAAIPAPDGVQYNEILRIDIPVSVDNAATMTGFFASDIDLNGDTVAGNEDIVFVLQNEQGTDNYRLFVDVDQDGDFNQANDMVIDFTNEVSATGGPADDAAIVALLGIVAMGNDFTGDVFINA